MNLFTCEEHGRGVIVVADVYSCPICEKLRQYEGQADDVGKLERELEEAEDEVSRLQSEVEDLREKLAEAESKK